jgi:hypothetical protein
MVNIMIQWMLTGILSLVHPFFISVIEINHNVKEATVEISVRVFSTDIEKTLQKYTTEKIDVENPKDNAFLDKQINQYLSKNLVLKINGQPVVFHYIGHEIQKESVWSFMEIPKITDVKKLEINCTILYDFESGQSNIFHVKSKGIEKSYKLDNPKSGTVFDF